MIKPTEVNFDGLVGPTHNYSGLSHGNVASTSHRASESNPREAVLQGLLKMKALADDGYFQGVFAPQERPHIYSLRALGFTGSDAKLLEKVAKTAPELLSAVSSASSMWTANAATVSPSADTADRKVHFTVANLENKFHRSIEAETTAALLKKMFKNPKYFVHHQALPAVAAFGDEGAANHTRLCGDYGKAGIEFFVYGRQGLRRGANEPTKFPARQTFEASEAIVRSHGLDLKRVVFAQQNPEAIDLGVFHNDVAGVGNQHFYFYHEQAYLNTRSVMTDLKAKFKAAVKGELILREVKARDITLNDAVKSYLFNSQILTMKSGAMVLIAPQEARETPSVARYLEKLLREKGQPITEVKFFDLRQSMRNGGGPACLRLRVVLNQNELNAVNPKVLMNEMLYSKLVMWAKKHYRDRLAIRDLSDPGLLRESRAALDQLTQILGLGSVYEFQKSP